VQEEGNLMMYFYDMNLDSSQIDMIKAYFRHKPVINAYIFGSYARNEQADQSDLDILVELDYTQQIGLQFVQMQIELQNLLKLKVDLVSSNALSRYIRPIVDAEKKLIYTHEGS
jgi:predicted nucleotidyltransferase